MKIKAWDKIKCCVFIFLATSCPAYINTVLPYSQVVNNLGGRGCGGGLKHFEKLLNREVKKNWGKQIEKGGGQNN